MKYYDQTLFHKHWPAHLNLRVWFLDFIILVTFISHFFFSLACSDILVNTSNEDWSFVAFGDVQQRFTIFGKLSKYINQLSPMPEFAICLGDIVQDSHSEIEWKKYEQNTELLRKNIPIHIVRGNHEGNDELAEELCRKYFNLNENDHFFKAFIIYQRLFIFLDTEIYSEVGFVTGKQLEWLKAKLEKASVDSNIFQIFIFMHRPLFSQRYYKGKDLENAKILHELFKVYPKIIAVFTGHDHFFNYYKFEGIQYITSGGGGGELHNGPGGKYHHFIKISFFENENRVNLSVIGIFNEILESFDL